MKKTIKKRSFTEREAAHYIGLAVGTLQQARCHGQRKNYTPTPPYIKIGRLVRYLREDLDDFLNNRAVKNTQLEGGR